MPRPENILYFYGHDDGTYVESSKILNFDPCYADFDWEMISGMSSHNEWKNYDVNGATEYHRNFRIALMQIVKEHPELDSYEIIFDGPPKIIRNLVTKEPPPEDPVWENITFYHGTSSELVRKIMDEGICPRSDTGSPAVYGAGIETAAPSNPDAIYLTTQRSAANFAARDAAHIFGGAPVVVIMSDIHFDLDRLIPDPDSREQTAKMSLWKLGSIGYLGTVWGQIWDVERIK